ncbi:MAG TPA: DUF1194 domain-containing protein [Dongiaceae bacterium]|nr:DUF1194 domain-containing protein [Dongiaceae bacterium]
MGISATPRSSAGASPSAVGRLKQSANALAVDLGLVLAVDCSSSADAADYKMQMGGIASALRDPSVQEAISAGTYRRIALALVQWSTAQSQVTTSRWRILASPRDLEATALEIETTERQSRPGGTGLAVAVDYSTALLQALPLLADRRVIDVSGDGADNEGGNAAAARNRALARGISINGLPILYGSTYLYDYYHDQVIGGPGAFVEPAVDMRSFRDAMLRKLVREISAPVA